MAVLPLRIQVRRDQDSLFNAENPLLLEGEIAFSIDKNKVKIGDGINRWQQLDYLDDELTARVDVLTADATVEGSVDAKVAAEAALRIEADDALAARLDTLEGDDSVADSVDAKIMVESMARQAADEALQVAIDAVQADVDQNEIDSNSADGILQQNIDALTTTVNANEADSDAADAALQAAIDAEIARVDALVATDMWLFADQSAFPSATLNHGRIVHSHADASMFYAHAGTWHKIEREDEAQAARDALQSIVNQNELASISRDGTLQTNLDNVEAAKANVGDVYTQTEIDTALGLKANSADVYTQTEVDDALALKADAADLTNVDNTSDADKPISTATQAALDTKANSADVYTQSEVTALVDAKADAADVSNVDNTSDADKPISTATQAALDLKADLAGPTFTGTTTAATLESTTMRGSTLKLDNAYLDSSGVLLLSSTNRKFYGGVEGLSQFTPDNTMTDAEKIEALEVAIQTLITELRDTNRANDTTPIDAG